MWVFWAVYSKRIYEYMKNLFFDICQEVVKDMKKHQRLGINSADKFEKSRNYCYPGDCESLINFFCDWLAIYSSNNSYVYKT